MKEIDNNEIILNSCSSEDDNDDKFLNGINDLTIEEIERRAKPIKDNKSDINWRYRSFDGFLGQKETMKKVIDEDDDIVTGLGWTHQELAKHMENIILICKKENLTSWKVIHYQFSRKKKKYSLFSDKYVATLKITRRFYASPQYSLFYNENTNNEKFNTFWNEEFLVENLETGISILIGGNESSGVIPYIKMLGFYEGGGVCNPYRIDPRILISVLTNEVTPDVINLVKKHEENQLFLLERELKEMEDDFEMHQKNLEKEDQNLVIWFSTAKDMVLKKIETQRESMIQRLTALNELYLSQQK